MGETGVTVAADECCVSWARGLEKVLIPEVWLALSGKIKRVDKETWGKKKDEVNVLKAKLSQESKRMVNTKHSVL